MEANGVSVAKQKENGHMQEVKESILVGFETAVVILYQTYRLIDSPCKQFKCRNGAKCLLSASKPLQ